MVQLSAIKEKLTWQLIVVVILFVAAAGAFAAFFLPLRLETRRLDGELNQLSQAEQQLKRIVEQRSGLESRLRELQGSLASHARVVPSQYDLQKVLNGIRRLTDFYGLKLESLSSEPLQVQEGGKVGLVPISMEVEGGGIMPGFLAHLCELLPSLGLAEAALAYVGEGRFMLSLRGELQVVLLDQASASGFELQELSSRQLVELPVDAFGLPFQFIAQFLQGQVRVLGIVNSGGQKAALIAQEGPGRWMRVGDRLEGAVITDINSGAVWLDLDGVQLQLTIGG